jgi:hypothetical protein
VTLISSTASLMIVFAVLAVGLFIGGPFAWSAYNEYRAFRAHRREEQEKLKILEERRLNEQIWSPPPRLKE